MEIRTGGIVGCGLRGLGITQVRAQAGYRSRTRELDAGMVHRGFERIDRFLAA